MNLNTILNNKDAVTLLALGQINFNAGLNMMKRLRADTKNKTKSEDDARGDTSVADEFAEYTPQQDTIPKLDVSANLVAASLLLASEIHKDELEFLKRNIKSPKGVIESQMDWMANQEAMQRLATAAKFGLTITVDTALAQIKGKNQDRVASFVTEAQSALIVNIKTMEARHLIHLIENTYDNPQWLAKLEDAAISLYEGAVKRIEAGKFADLPDELIQFAQDALKRRGKM